MGRPSKGGRRKNVWNVSATIGALDRLVGDEPDRGRHTPERKFLDVVRALCLNLQANMTAISAFDRLLRLMRERAGPVRRYAREVGAAFRAYRPLVPAMHEVLKKGEADELWNLWFFAREMPRRLNRAMVNVDRLLYAGEAFMPAPFTIPGFQVTAARAVVILGLRSHGYDAGRIAALLDPAGHEQNKRAARDRIRKEIRRLEAAAVSNGHRGGRRAKAELLKSLARSGPTGRPE
jgi:hypothetical protein